MEGVAISHLNASIKALLTANYDLKRSTVEDALSKVEVYGKKDTLGLDAGPEITICRELNEYDSGSAVITEEIGIKAVNLKNVSRLNEPEIFKTVFILDPTDRSNQFKAFLTEFPREMKLSNIMGNINHHEKWEEKFGSPVSVTGALSAITCIRRGIPIFSVIVNYITQELMMSCDAGNKILRLPDKMPKLSGFDFDYVCENGKNIFFPIMNGKVASMQKFVTFLGDTGKLGYRENFIDSGFMTELQIKEFLAYEKPGGPSRALYLSSLQPHDEPLGFVLANGEKIGEWIHWLPFIRFAKSQSDNSKSALKLYEIYQERPWTKEGILMSTSANYSVFKEYDGKLFVDTSTLLQMPNPSHMRSTLIVAPYDNRWVANFCALKNFREIKF